MISSTMAEKVVDPYAEALIALGSGQGLLDTFAADMRFIAEVLRAIIWIPLSIKLRWVSSLRCCGSSCSTLLRAWRTICRRNS